jgi:FKBP-type peptidyl-prolyl cis-trans isomerase
MFSSLRFSVVLLISISLTGAVQAVDLDSEKKRLSYAFGYLYAQQFKQQGTMLDMEAFSAAANDVLQGKEIRMTKEEMSATMQAYRTGLDEDLRANAEARLKAGQAFLEKNKKRPGVVVLDSGVQYIEHMPGEGAPPSASAKIKLHYRGTLIDGTEFDSSYNDSGEPASFELQGVIRGFLEAVTQMKPGAKWTVFIPTHLAYGIAGWSPKIGPNEALIFDIELVSVE